MSHYYFVTKLVEKRYVTVSDYEKVKLGKAMKLGKIQLSQPKTKHNLTRTLIYILNRHILCLVNICTLGANVFVFGCN